MRTIYSLLSLFLGVLLIPAPTQAQDSFTGNSTRPWYYPDHVVIQFAGNKISYRPWKIDLKKDFVLEPLKVGTGISYSAGSQFQSTWPGRYPEGYYWWTNSYRFTPFLGPTISKKVGSGLSLIKRVQAYAELGTNDLALVSFVNNKKLAITEIWNIGLGTRLVF